MARGRPAKATQALKLAEALTFVGAATGDYGLQTHEFVNLNNKRAVCFDGTLAAGMEIEEELTLAPKLETLKAALNKTGKSLTLTELPSGRLSVKGEKITVQVPCIPVGDLPEARPDPAIAPITDEIKEALKALEAIITDSGERVFETSILLEGNVATATNGKVLMQYWHGIDLPPHMILPRPFVKAVTSQFKSLVAFGYTPDISVTFWFEDGSWYKTQLYNDKYPDCKPLLDVQSAPTASPVDLWEGCKEIAEFHPTQWITFKDNAIVAGVAKYPVEGLQGGKQFDYNVLKKVIPYIKTIDLTTYGDRALFFGEKIRGVIMGVINQEAETVE